ncbi:MAG: hypothetical protein ACLFVS_04370 [Candidatus Acetothermia bacterium]
MRRTLDGSTGYLVPLLVSLALALLLLTGLCPVQASGEPEIFVSERAVGRLFQPNFSFLSMQPVSITLDSPRGVTCGPGGLLYVVESCNRRIIRFNQQGEYKEEVVVDEPQSTFSGQPLNLVFGPDDNLYFTTPKRGLWTLKDGDPRNDPEQLIEGSYFDRDETLHDLAFLKTGEYSGDIVVSVFTEKPFAGYVIRIPGPDFNQVRPFISEYSVEEKGQKVTNHLRVPVAVAVNEVGEVFVADHEIRENHVLRYTPGGEFVDIFVERMNNPLDLNFSASGKLYAVLGPLWPDEQEGGGLKVFNKLGDQESFIPWKNLWEVALCESRW